MIIVCYCCKTECPGLDRWHRHLLSNHHQAVVRKAATTSDVVVKENLLQPEMMARGTTSTIFLLQSSSILAAPRPRDLETLVKLASLGFVHDFYVHYDQTKTVVVNLECRNGLSQETVIQESKSIGYLATPFLASSQKDWDEVILFLNNADDLVQKFRAAVEIAAKKDLKSKTLPPVPPSLSLESSRPTVGPGQKSKKKRKAVETESIVKPTTATGLYERVLLRFEDSQLTQTQLEERVTVLRNLECCLKTWTWFSKLEIQLHPYGSYLTGLGDQRSDLDVTMTGHESMKMSAVEFAKEMRTMLKTYRCNGTAPFRNIQMILGPVELVRFTDISTRISCDLSFSNLLAVRNSELIGFILGLDPRIRQLVLLVRRWGSFYRLAGSTKLKNYTIALLVLVFLARKKFIPTIRTLQSLGEEEIIHGWNAGFTRDAEAVRSWLDSCRSAEEANYYATATLLQLTTDFFHFFANENFANNVLCCLTAESIPKPYFGSLETIKKLIPQQYEYWKRRMECRAVTEKGPFRLKIKVFTIQDPFNLASNVGKSVSMNVWKKLLHIVGATAEYLSSLDESKN